MTMLIKKEFYFVRHGQTDANVAEGDRKDLQVSDPSFKEYGDLSLNRHGRNQARALIPLIASLPIKSVFSSPLQRAKETKELACGLTSSYTEAPLLSECGVKIWQEMTGLGKAAITKKEGDVHHFMQRVRDGINEILLHEGPVLIVAHGGIHWAACCLMGLEEHDWIIDNCIVTHFSINPQGHWMAKKCNNPISILAST